MEDSGSVRPRGAAHVTQGADRKELLSTKPLHRFVQREPKSVGVAVLMFGCAELLVGFPLAGAGDLDNSSHFYTSFWQGALFVVCGTLSIYTGIHPSKKMVTVCLSMFVVSLMGIIVSFGFRIWAMVSMERYSYFRYSDDHWDNKAPQMVSVIEALLLVSSLCVSVLLIFLCVVARLALKSTHTQIVLHQIPPTVSEAPTELT